MAIQDKFNRPNVIYKITKDIDLGGGTLTIPEGCTLDFQGGSFSNGTIVFDKTFIKADRRTILPCRFEGQISNDQIYIEWFGVNDDGIFDNTSIIQSVFDCIQSSVENIDKTILFVGKKYRITDTIYIPRHITIKGVHNPNTYSGYNSSNNSEIMNSVIFADFSDNKFAFESDVFDGNTGKRFSYYSRMRDSYSLIGNNYSVNISNINIAGNCFGGIRLFSWIGGEIHDISIAGTKVGIVIGRSWNTKITRCSLTTKVYGLILCGEVTTTHIDSVQCTYKSAYSDYVIEIEDTKIIEDEHYAFDSKVDFSWINESSISFMIINSNVTMTNCVGERYDVSVLAINSDIVMNGYYAEKNYKSVIMSDISNIIINSLYGANERFIFTEDEWNNRFNDYVLSTRGHLILNNCKGGTISHPFNSTDTNRKIFNVINLTINSENFDKDLFPYIENHDFIQIANLPNNIYIDDTIEDDSNNWGFSSPIKFSTFLERLAKGFNNNIYTRKKYNVCIKSDCVIDSKIQIPKGEFDFISHSDRKTITFNNPLQCRELKASFYDLNINALSAVCKSYETVSLFNNIDITFRNCDINSPRLFTMTKDTSLLLTIYSCSLNEDIETVFVSNSVVPRNVVISASNCNIIIDNTNNYKCSYNIPLMNKVQYNNYDELPILPPNCSGYITYCLTEKRPYMYIKDKWEPIAIGTDV